MSEECNACGEDPGPGPGGCDNCGDAYPDAPWHGEEPEQVTVGHDPTVLVGNFTCACGRVIADSETGDGPIELMTVTGDRERPDATIDCPGCPREWRLVDRGKHWEADE